ncbi:MAG TPA: hypothetical protein VJ866_24810 [Pyrinomonadaceae bacterium]|nr:hypothetical protein [Pyrinomonadaceae bacterium]
MDITRSWEAARAAPFDWHEPGCRFRETYGGLLCDCRVLGDRAPRPKATPRSERKDEGGAAAVRRCPFKGDFRRGRGRRLRPACGEKTRHPSGMCFRHRPRPRNF